MGQEIDRHEFTPAEFTEFKRRLREETLLLREKINDGGFAGSEYKMGYELEAWLLDSDGNPAARNEELLPHVDRSLITQELSKFNVELNGQPETCCAGALSRLHESLQHAWDASYSAATKLGLEMAMIGILPTIREQQLCMANMTESNRYKALNDEINRLRDGRIIEFNIQGEDLFQSKHHDVMLESATTSFQMHFQLPLNETVNAYNISAAISAAMVAISTNSPLLFGRRLWRETRIPLFEQSVVPPCMNADDAYQLNRVSFGSGYARDSLWGFFNENRQHYPVLLPILSDEPADRFAHVRLHNGTVWRWNRPLIGFDDNGNAQLRLEHRPVASNPTVIDNMANLALYVGLLGYHLQQGTRFEKVMPFERIRENFYAAAKNGLSAELHWLEDRFTSARQLFEEFWLGQAAQGLEYLGADMAEIDRYMLVLNRRVQNHQTGACWQRRAFDVYQGDLRTLTREYLIRQKSGLPVAEWVFD